nr:MAG TPA: hypothetical protein [Caudoviricetes sp.]
MLISDLQCNGMARKRTAARHIAKAEWGRAKKSSA